MSALEIATTANVSAAGFLTPAPAPKPNRSPSPPKSIKSKISSLLRRSPSPPPPASLSPPAYSPTASAGSAGQAPLKFTPKRKEAKNVNYFLLASGHNVPA